MLNQVTNGVIMREEEISQTGPGHVNALEKARG